MGVTVNTGNTYWTLIKVNILGSDISEPSDGASVTPVSLPV